MVYHLAILQFCDHVGLYRQLARRPIALLVLSVSGLRIYQFYTVRRRTYQLYRFTILPIYRPLKVYAAN